MTPSRRLFERLTQRYAARDYSGVAACYQTPGALYLDKEVVVWSGPDRLQQLLSLHCGTNREFGVARVEAQVTRELHHSDRQMSAWVDWRHYSASGEELYVLTARHFCGLRPDGEAYVQLVEVLALPAIGRVQAALRRILRAALPEAPKLALVH